MGSFSDRFFPLKIQNFKDSTMATKTQQLRKEHFWIGSRGSDSLVCENCGLVCLDKDVTRYNNQLCIPLKPPDIQAFQEVKAFEDQIEANPADKTARLVFADWLEEHGDPVYSQSMREAPDWLVKKDWHSENNGPYTAQPIPNKVSIIINSCVLRTRVIVWCVYLSKLIYPINRTDDFQESPPYDRELYPVFPTEESIQILVQMIYIIQGDE